METRLGMWKEGESDESLRNGKTGSKFVFSWLTKVSHTRPRRADESLTSLALLASDTLIDCWTTPLKIIAAAEELELTGAISDVQTELALRDLAGNVTGRQRLSESRSEGMKSAHSAVKEVGGQWSGRNCTVQRIIAERKTRGSKPRLSWS